MKIYIKKKWDIFYVCFLIWLASDILLSSYVQEIMPASVNSFINNFISLFVIILLAYRCIFQQKYEQRELLVIIPISFLILLSAVLSGDNFLLVAWLFIIASKKISFREIMKVIVVVLAILIFLIILLNFLGVISEYTIYRGSRTRHSWGFSHPNQLGIRIFQLVVGVSYLFEERKALRKYIFFIAALLFVYYVPNSLAAVISIFLIIVLMGLLDISKGRGNIEKIYSKTLPLLALLFNGISILFCNTDIRQYKLLSLINSNLSYRFSNSYKVWQLYGLSWFGQPVYVSSVEQQAIGTNIRLWLDNAYASMILRYGIIVYAVFSILYIYLMIRLFKQGEVTLATIIFIFAVYGVMEKGLYQLTFNNYLLLFSTMLYGTTIIRGKP